MLNDEQAKWEPKEDALTLRWPRPPSSPASGALGSAPIHLHLSRPCMRVFRVFLPRDAASLFAFLHGPVFSRDSSEIPDRLFATPGTTRFCLFAHPGFAFLCITAQKRCRIVASRDHRLCRRWRTQKSFASFLFAARSDVSNYDYDTRSTKPAWHCLLAWYFRLCSGLLAGVQ